MEEFDWYDYAVGGAASRPDSFSRLNPDYARAVSELLLAADEELGPRSLLITSAYRSPELQAQLYADEVAKAGSPEAARRMVAPPGYSRHNYGLAVDFADATGALLRDPNSREAQWLAENASRFGLGVPMSWEPWQVELMGPDGRRLPLPISSGVAALSGVPRPASRPEVPAEELSPREEALRKLDTLMTSLEFMQGDPEYCPAGYVYDPATESCVPAKPLEPLRASKPTGSTALQRFGISSLV